MELEKLSIILFVQMKGLVNQYGNPTQFRGEKYSITIRNHNF